MRMHSKNIQQSSELNKSNNSKLSSKTNTKISCNKLTHSISNFNNNSLNSNQNHTKMIDFLHNFNHQESKTNNFEHILSTCNKRVQGKCHKVEY